MTTLWFYPSLSCPESTDKNLCLHLLDSFPSRGLKTIFFKVNNIIRMLIFFLKCGFRTSAYSTHRLSSQCYPPFCLVSDHSHKENGIFPFLPYPHFKTCLYSMLLQFKCNFSLLTLPAWTSFLQTVSVPLREDMIIT